jgi:uncharacterized protein (TIGR02147 family)
MDIDLYAFTDFREFLVSWLKARPQRSYGSLAKKMGCSKSLVAAIVTGDRVLQDHWIAPLVRATGLDEAEARYFRDLVEVMDSSHRDRRQAAMTRVTGTQRFRKANSASVATWRLYSCWYYGAILELARSPGFNGVPADIIARLGPALTLEQVEEALESLRELGLLRQEPTGEWTVSEVVLTSGHEIHKELVNLALYRLYPELLELAVESLDRVPGERRRFAFATVGIPRAALPDYKRLVSSFMEQVIALSTKEGEVEEVYQIGVQLFPVTNEVEGD